MGRFIRYGLVGFAVITVSFTACSYEKPTGVPIDIEDDPTLFQKLAAEQAQIPGRYIVVLRDAERNVPAVASEMAQAHGLSIGHTYRFSIKGFSAVIPEARLNILRGDSRIAYIEQDRAISVGKPADKPGKKPPKEDPREPQVTPWGINRVGGTGNGVGRTAWIIDTGIDLDHPDLNVDVGRSVNFVSRGKKTPDDGNGHGTHVAGTIAAIDDEWDVVGVAAGATVIAVRVLDRSGSGSYSDVIAGVDYVAANAAAGDVANMSLTGPASPAMDDAVKAAAAKGIFFSLAAGNYGSDANGYSPARANGANILTISATDISDYFASFSNWGNPPVDYAAPGVSILSTKKGGGTTTMSGTSMAAPHVAGLLLLGSIHTDGYALNDPDGQADPIAHR